MTRFFIILITITISFSANCRNYIRAVGSSTVYPFVTIAAERFGKIHGHTPIVEATGTGAGFHLLCSGNSLKYPDIVNASRLIKNSELNYCNEKGVKNLNHFILGYDGIIIAQNSKSKNFNLTRKELYLSLAKKIFDGEKWINNKYLFWNEINSKLPKSKIEIYGPSFNSGTRDALIDLVMKEFAFEIQYQEIREDGCYIEVPENENLIIHKLQNNNKALDIINFNTLIENS